MKQLLTIGSFGLMSLGLLAQDGSIDNSFNDNAAMAWLNPGQIESEIVQHTIVLPDNRIVFAGISGTPGSAELMVGIRKADGTPDSSFNANGYVIVNLVANDEETISGLTHYNNKIYVYGHVGTIDRDWFVGSFNMDGTLNTPFGESGTGFLSLDVQSSSDDILHHMAFDSQGRILLCGASDDPQFNNGFDMAIARLTSTGSLDLTFNTTGKLIWSLSSGDDQAVRVLEDGNTLWIAGYGVSSQQEKAILGKLNQDGSKVFSFGTNARVFMSFGNGDYEVKDAVLTPGGGILFGGTSNSGNDNLGLMKWKKDGTLDNNFSLNGLQELDPSIGGNDGLTDLVAFGSGFLVAGFSNPGNNNMNCMVARIDSVGNLVTTFANNGIHVEDVFLAADDAASSIAVQGTDRLIVTGYGLNGNEFLSYMYRLVLEPEAPVSGLESLQSTVLVYPNPSQGLVQQVGMEGSATLMDLSGKVLMTWENVPQSLNLTSLASGLYLLKGNQGVARIVLE